MSILRVGGSLARAGGALGRATVGGGESRALLSSSDFSFDGWIRLPRTVTSDNGDGNHFSNAGFAVRKVSGQLRAFVNYGFGNTYTLLTEVVLPTSGLTSTLTGSTPIATIHHEWSSVLGGTAGDGVEWGRVGSGIDTYTHGLCWDDVTQTLWWQMGTAYGGANSNYVSIGAIKLNDGTMTATPYGRWRTSSGSQQTRGFMMRVPDWYANAYLGGNKFAVGAQMSSGVGTGDFSSPFGIGVQSAVLPDPTTTPGDSLTNTAQISITTTPLALFTQAHKMPRPGQYRGLDGPYDGVCEVGSQAGTALQGMTVRTDWLEEVDDIGTGIWIDTGTKHGVVFFGQLLTNIPGYSAPGDPDGLVHGGYGDPTPNSGPPNHTPTGFMENGTTPRVKQCCHGQDDPTWGSTGPWGHAMVPWVWIADPMDFTSVVGGNPWDTAPYSNFRMNDLLSFTTHASGRWERRWVSSAYFDTDTNKLYVPIKRVDTTRSGNPQWAIARFSVG